MTLLETCVLVLANIVAILFSNYSVLLVVLCVSLLFCMGFTTPRPASSAPKSRKRTTSPRRQLSALKRDLQLIHSAFFEDTEQNTITPEQISSKLLNSIAQLDSWTEELGVL
jgi:hypothetical protein